MGGAMNGKRPNDTDNLEAALDASIDDSIRLAGENADLQRFNETLLNLLQLLLDTWQAGGDLDGTIEKIAAELEALSKRKVN